MNAVIHKALCACFGLLPSSAQAHRTGSRTMDAAVNRVMFLRNMGSKKTAQRLPRGKEFFFLFFLRETECFPGLFYKTHA